MELDDVEDALDNPPEQLKEYFNNGGKFNVFFIYPHLKRVDFPILFIGTSSSISSIRILVWYFHFYSNFQNSYIARGRVCNQTGCYVPIYNPIVCM